MMTLPLQIEICVNGQDLDRCLKFIEDSKEARHLKTMSRQKEKLKALTSRKLETNKGAKEVAAQTTGIVADTCIVAILTLAVQIRSLVQRERQTLNILTGRWRKAKTSG